MSADDEKAVLVRYLDQLREAWLWKLEGVDDLDVRRPLTPTGSNLLGLTKHVAACAAEYAGEVPLSDDDPLIDLWCPAEETRADVLDLWDRAWAHAAQTIDALPLGAAGRVPWWGDRGAVTLHQILVHMNVELARHAGHVDVLREGLDGFAGLRPGVENMPDDTDWPAHVARVEKAAHEAAGR